MGRSWKSLRGSLHGSLHGNFVVYLWALLACLGWGLKIGLHIFPLSHFPGGSDGKESTCNVGHLGSVSGLGRSPRRGHGNPLRYSCLENPQEPGRLQSMGSQRVRHDWAIKHSTESINNIVLASDVQQSDSVIHLSIPFQILFPSRLLQNTE